MDLVGSTIFGIFGLVMIVFCRPLARFFEDTGSSTRFATRMYPRTDSGVVNVLTVVSLIVGSAFLAVSIASFAGALRTH